MKCNFRHDDTKRSLCNAKTPHGARKCHAHRNNLPAWAQSAIDAYFGVDATIGEWSPGDRRTRYSIENASGSHSYTTSYLGRSAFLDALRMLHYATTAARRAEFIQEGTCAHSE